ncbi:MAG TPA: type II toxin-antitoxin system HipA family toxin [Desulfuromonadales bacterium]|nr:type II toxin-antitoxin system HipA family toxin [Desulfuromonadales bacterium]
MTNQLAVYINTTKAGILERDGRLLTFSYSPDYLDLPGASPISRLLPLGSRVYGDDATRAFFSNLLPEGAVLTQVARQIGVSRENVFGLLEAIGGDCAGAISVRTAGSQPEPDGSYRRISEQELSDELDRLPSHPFLAGDEGVRLSLAGAQNKLPVFFNEGNYYIPEGTSPSSHILKTAIEQLDSTVINETFCMTLAARVGLPVPTAQVVIIGGRQVFMVERYDRIWTASGEILRLHQEDFCQSLGIPPELKYEKEGGPGFGNCFKLVEEWSSEPLLDTGFLLNWAIYNFITGNADAHGKNISFLYRDGLVRLAPFYDLISTAVYKRLDSRFAMKMGGQRDPRYLPQDTLVGFAAEIGIDKRIVKSTFVKMMDNIAAQSTQLFSEYRGTFGDLVILGDIARVIDYRITKGRQLIQF